MALVSPPSTAPIATPARTRASRASASATDGAQGVDQDGDNTRPEQGEPDIRQGRGQTQHAHRHGDRKGGTGVDPEDAGIGERVAGERLDQRAICERRPHDETDHSPGESRLVDHQVIDAGDVVGPERSPDRRPGNRVRPSSEAQHRHRGQGARGDDRRPAHSMVGAEPGTPLIDLFDGCLQRHRRGHSPAPS